MNIPAVVFNGYLYAGTVNFDEGGQIWRSSDGTEWTQMNFGDANNKAVYPRGVFDDYLYVGTFNSVTGGEIWRSSDGTVWAQVSEDGFGDSNNVITYAEVVFNDCLYFEFR
jgi:hypothetical protein